MQNLGWIKLHRKLKDHWLWQSDKRLKWWIDILISSNHTENKVLIKGTLVDCGRGQCIKSLQSWAKDWNVTKKTVSDFFKLLQKDNMIFIENLKITTRITVCNYDTYNDSVNAEYTPSKRQVNAKYTPSKREQHTNNNVKNDNNENNENKRGGEEILPPPKLIESDLCSFEEKQNQIAINETNSPTNEIQKEKKVATKKRKYKSPLELGLVIPPVFKNGLKESFLEFCEMRATRTGKKKLPVDSQRKINRLANDMQKLEKYDQEIQKEIIEYSTDHLYDSFYIPNHLKQEKNNNHEKSDGEIILERIQKKYDL